MLLGTKPVSMKGVYSAGDGVCTCWKPKVKATCLSVDGEYSEKSNGMLHIRWPVVTYRYTMY